MLNPQLAAALRAFSAEPSATTYQILQRALATGQGRFQVKPSPNEAATLPAGSATPLPYALVFSLAA